jgi:hypothetical protein
MRSLSTFVLAACLLAVAAPAAEGGKKKIKAALTCATTSVNGDRVVLTGKGKARHENPVTCLVTLVAPDDQEEYVAEVWTTYKAWSEAESKAVSVETDKKTGNIHDWPDDLAPFKVTLSPGDGPGADYVPCSDFTIHARVMQPDVMWTGKLVVKQFCPD